MYSFCSSIGVRTLVFFPIPNRERDFITVGFYRNVVNVDVSCVSEERTELKLLRNKRQITLSKPSSFFFVTSNTGSFTGPGDFPTNVFRRLIRNKNYVRTSIDVQRSVRPRRPSKAEHRSVIRLNT